MVGGSSVLGVGLGWGLLLGLAGVVTVSVGLAVVAAYGAARRSRGGLVADFLKGEEDARTYCLRLSKVRLERTVEGRDKWGRGEGREGGGGGCAALLYPW